MIHVSKRLLILEDEVDAADDLEDASRRHGWEFHSYDTLRTLVTAATTDPRLFRDTAVAVIDFDIAGSTWADLPDYEPRPEVEAGSKDKAEVGIHVAAWLRATFPDVQVVFHTRQMTTEQKLLADKLVADAPTVDKSNSPAHFSRLFQVIEALYQRWLISHPPELPPGFSGRTFETMATSRLPLRIRGESGTGKHTLAQRLHEASRRSARAFATYGCGMSDAARGEVFGRVDPPASDVGAVVRALGVRPTEQTPSRTTFADMLRSCVTADGAAVEVRHGAPGEPWTFGPVGGRGLAGTLVLEDVDLLLGPSRQALVELLDRGLIHPEGHAGPAWRVDVRVVSTSTIGDDPPEPLPRGLIERLGGWVITLPSLRDRVEEALALAEKWVREYVDPVDAARGEPRLQLEDSGRRELEALIRAGWFSASQGAHENEGGNFRGLRRLVERACGYAARGSAAETEVSYRHVAAAQQRAWSSPLRDDAPSPAALDVALKTLTETSGSLLARLAPTAEAEPDEAFAASDAELVRDLALRLKDDAARFTRTNTVSDVTLRDWLASPAWLCQEKGIAFDPPSRLRWRWLALVAGLVATVTVGKQYKNVSHAFTGRSDNNAASPVRDQYQRFLSGNALDFVLPDDRPTRGADGSLLPLLVAALRGTEPDRGPAVTVQDKVFPYEGMKLDALRVWSYLQRVYRMAEPSYRDRVNRSPRSS